MHFLISLLLLSPFAAAPDPGEVLREWDAQRAQAYAASDAGGLKSIYTPGSAALRADLALLADYERRGVRVWLRTQVFALHPVQVTSRSLVLRVTDRTLSAVADGMRCRELPASVPTTRNLRLMKIDGTWVVDSVTAVGVSEAAQPEGSR